MSDSESSGSSSPETTTPPTALSPPAAAASPRAAAPPPTNNTQPTSSPSAQSKYKAAIDSLSPLLASNTIPPSVSSSSSSLLHDPSISSQISALLRHPDSGAGDNNLCRWLYDTFQSSLPDLQLVILRYVPLIAGLYLSRCCISQHRPLAGFEAVLLALYAHETTSRSGEAITVTLPDLSNPSVYHESNAPVKNTATELNIAVLSPGLEPHGTVRSTRRARIVGVALELYYSKILQMPLGSKLEFCEFCKVWAGPELGDIMAGDGTGDDDDDQHGGGRIPLPWELLQPCLRILGHCLMGGNRTTNKDDQELYDKACGACRCLYARALHDIDPKAILASRTLLNLINMEAEAEAADDLDPTEIKITRVISL
ncbi:hypothetical protein Dimus_034360 [Dionaea muscipula]